MRRRRHLDVVVVVVVDRSPHEQPLVARASSTYSLSLYAFVLVLLNPLYDAHALYHVRTTNISDFLFLKYIGSYALYNGSTRTRAASCGHLALCL